MEFTFTGGFGHVSEVAFAMCGNPTKVFPTDITHRNYLSILRDQHDFNNFCKFELANFEKRWLYTSFGQPQKMNFSIKKGILGWVRVNDP